MTDADAKPFAELIATARAAFNQPVDTAIGALYWRVLRPYDLDEVRAVLDKQLATAERMPPPGPLAQELKARWQRKRVEDETARLLAQPAAPVNYLPAAQDPARRRKTRAKPSPWSPRVTNERTAEEDEHGRWRIKEQAYAMGITDADIAEATRKAFEEDARGER